MHLLVPNVLRDLKGIGVHHSSILFTVRHVRVTISMILFKIKGPIDPILERLDTRESNKYSRKIN